MLETWNKEYETRISCFTSRTTGHSSQSKETVIMSAQSTFSSSSSYTVSSTSQGGDRTTTGQQTSYQTVTDDQGNTTVHSVKQNLGEPAVELMRQYDSSGRQLNGATGSRSIEDISDDQQAKNDRDYEERMEEE